MQRSSIVLAGIIVLFIGLIVIFSSRGQVQKIASFQDCMSGGNPVAESYPRTCRTKDGRTFTEIVETPAPTTSLSPQNSGTPTIPTTTIEANITIADPKQNQKIGNGYVVSGQARVFENVLQYRLKDAKGVVLAEGNTSAQSPDVGQFGPYVITLRFDTPKTKSGTLEVFSASPKDGSEINMQTVGVRF